MSRIGGGSVSSGSVGSSGGSIGSGSSGSGISPGSSGGFGSFGSFGFSGSSSGSGFSSGSSGGSRGFGGSGSSGSSGSSFSNGYPLFGGGTFGGPSSGSHSHSHSSKHESPTVLKIFIDDASPNNGFAGRILDVHGDMATYALACTSGPEDKGYCNNYATSLTVTQGPGTHIVTSTSVSSGARAMITKSCSVDRNATVAACTATVEVNDGILALPSVTMFDVTGVTAHQVPATITAGLEKLGGGEKVVESRSAGRGRIGFVACGVMILACAAAFSGL